MSAVIGALRAELSATVAKFQRDMGRAADTVKQTSREFTRVGNDFRRVGSQMQSVGTALTKTVTLPLLGAGAAIAKVGIDFESTFAGVRKTVAASEPEFAALAQGFRNLAKEIPISVNELNKIGESAGQLGIPKAALLDFTKVIAELGVTTNLSSDEAAIAIARIQNIFGAVGKDTDRFGSTVVALGNNFATTEAEIVNFATRIAGAAKVVGVSQGQTLAFGAALSSVGVEAEAGGTAISKVFGKLASAVAMGGSQLAAFAKVAGQSSEAFATSFRTNAAGATTAFIEGLGRINKEGGNVFQTLNDLELSDERMKRALLSAAGAGDLLRRALDMQNKAWQENSALTNEAAERFKTTASQLQLLVNRIKDVGITIFNAMKPAIDSAIVAVNALVPYLEMIAKAFAALPGSVQLGIIGFAAFAAALGPVIFLAGQLVSSIAQLTLAFGKGGIGTRVIIAALEGGRKALAAFNVMLKGGPILEWVASFGRAGAVLARFGGLISTLITSGFAPLGAALGQVAAGLATLLNPVTLTIAAIAAVTLGVIALTGHWDDLKAGVSAVVQVVKDAGTVLWFLAKSVFGALLEGARELASWLAGGIVSGFRALVGAAVELGRWLADLAAQIAGPLIGAFQQWVAWVKDHIPGWMIALVGKVQDVAAATKQLATEGAASLHEYADAVREAAETAAQAFTAANKGLEGYRKTITDRALPEAALGIGEAFELLNRQLKAASSGSQAAGLNVLTEQLRAAKKELADLQPGKLAELTEAIRSTAFSTKELAEGFGISETAVKLLSDRLSAGSKDVNKFGAAWREVASIGADFRKTLEAIDGAVVEGVAYYLRRGASVEQLATVYGLTKEQIDAVASSLKYADLVAEGTSVSIARALETMTDAVAEAAKKNREAGNAAFLKNIGATVDAYRKATDIRKKLSLSEYEYQVYLIRQEAQERKDALDSTGSGYADALAAIDDETEARLGEAAQTWREKMAEMNAATNSWGNLTKKWLEGIPGLLQRAFEGGGGFGGAVKSMLSGIGGDIGTKVFGDLAAKMSNTLSRAFGPKITEAFGTLIPGIGGALGSLVGPLIGKLASWIKGAPEWKKLGKDIARDFGVNLSESLLKQMEDDSKKFGRQAAGLLNLDKIIGESGGLSSKNVEAMTGKLRDVFSLIQTGAISAAQGAGVLDKNFQAFADNWLSKGPLISRELVEIVQLTRQAGLESKAVGDFIKGQVSNNIIAGLQAFTAPSKAAADSIADIKKQMEELKAENNELFEKAGTGRLSAEDEKRAAALDQQYQSLKKQLEAQEALEKSTSVTSQNAANALAGSVFVAFKELQKAGTPILEIAKQLQPVVAQLGSQFEAAGFSGGEAFNEIREMVALAADEIAGPALQAATGLGQTMAGLSNIGKLSQESFSGLAEQIGSTFSSLVAQGKNGDQVLRLMQQPLQTIWQLANEFGYAVDDSTKALLDQAAAAGVVGEAQKPVQEQMLDATLAIKDAVTGLAQVFGVELPAKVAAGASSVQGSAQQMADSIRTTVGDAAKAASDALATDLPAGAAQAGLQIKKDLGGGIDAANEAVRIKLEEMQRMFGEALPEAVGSGTEEMQKAFAILSGEIGEGMGDASEATKLAVDKALQILENSFGGLPDEAQDAARQISDELSKIRVPEIRIPVAFDPTQNSGFSGYAGNLPTPNIEGFATGTRGLRDFGAGELAVLHRREAVVPEDEYNALIAAAQAGVSGDGGAGEAVSVSVQLTFTGFLTDENAVRRAVDEHLVPELKEAIRRDEGRIRGVIKRAANG